jgi:hypothetical protein
VTRLLTGLLAAGALVAAGCGGTAAQPHAGASSIVPASAAAFMAIDSDVSSAQWQTIDRLASKFPDKQKALDSIKQDLAKENVDWVKDVEPALGAELDFVWLDFDGNGRHLVGLTRPQDQDKFKALVEKANKSADKPADKVFYDAFKGWAVVSPEQPTIDRFEQESESATTTLAEDTAFTQAMGRLGQDAVLRAFVNGNSVMELARKRGGAQMQSYIDKVGTLDWAALRFSATSAGLGLDTIVHGTPGSLLKGSPSFSPKLLGTIPADALLSISFKGSKNMFGSLKQNPVFSTPQFRRFGQPLQALGRILEGENALYARPSAGRIPEVTLVSTPKIDGTAVLDRMVSRFAGAPPQARTVDGTAVHALASNGIGIYYANVDGKLVVTDQPGGIRSVKHPGKSLSESEDFKNAKVAAGAPDKTWGLLYVNISSSVPYVEKLAGSRIPAEIARNLKPLRSAVEYAASHTHELQVTFFLRIK